MKLRYKGNAPDPRDEQKYMKSYDVTKRKEFLENIRKRVIGRPQGTKRYSPEQLAVMGYVGTYELELKSIHEANQWNRVVDYSGWLESWVGELMGWCSIENSSSAPATSSCPDCNGSGKYVGLTAVEDCGTCKVGA